MHPKPGLVEFWSFLRKKHDLRDLWFQQDRVKAHTTRISLAVLQRIFPGQLGSLRGDIGWPASSPNLSICDFLLRGYFKNNIFKHRPYTIEDLKVKITEESMTIPIETCRKSYVNFRGCLQTCIDADGRHRKNVIF